MADEIRRKRGRRRGGRHESAAAGATAAPENPPADPQGGPDVIADEPEVPGVTGARFRFFRRARASGAAVKAGESRPHHRTAAPDVNPMDFWRTGGARSYRAPVRPEKKKTGLSGLFANFYIPPWAPVVGIIVIVFAILGALFLVRSATGAPRIGDHWHAPYTFYACGEKQPNAPTWEGVGVHTHGDGLVHIHPFQTAEEGPGARLIKWFEYGGGKLDNDEIRMPGSSTTYRNGDKCPDGEEGVVQVYVTRAGQSGEERLQGDALERYIPHDGDVIRLVFGPPEQTVQQEDRTIIPEDQAVKTLEITVTDTGPEGTTKFDPARLQINRSEVTKLVIKNTGTISHGFRVAGADGKYDTRDDFVSTPEIILPGQQGVAVVRLDTDGEVEFRDETVQQVTGKLVVTQGAAPTPSPTPGPQAETVVDVTMRDNLFEPAEITVPAGKEFQINLSNAGRFGHNMRIAGPDGVFETEDDIVSEPLDIRPGRTGTVLGKIDEPGAYQFRDDFHPTEATGVITVQ